MNIYELILEEAFSAALGKSSAPEILLFKKFKENWTTFNRRNSKAGSEDIIVDEVTQHERSHFVSSIT